MFPRRKNDIYYATTHDDNHHHHHLSSSSYFSDEAVKIDDNDGTAEHVVEIRCQALKSTMGFVDHYFLVVEDLEYHMGYYKKGSILPLGTTKGSHTVCVKNLCDQCYDKIAADYNLREDKRLFGYYPLINCESLSTGLSLQSLAILALPFVFTLIAFGRLVYALVLTLVVLLLVLSYSKYVFSRSSTYTCPHLLLQRQRQRQQRLRLRGGGEEEEERK